MADDNTKSELAVEGLRIVGMDAVKRGADGKWDLAGLPREADAAVASDVLRAMDDVTKYYAQQALAAGSGVLLENTAALRGGNERGT